MLKINLAGEMGEIFIPSFEAEVNSASDVIRCLTANFPNFLQYLVDATARGIRFCVRAGYQELDEADLGKPFSKKVASFTLTPIPQGAKGTLGKILVGVALIGAGFLTGGIGGVGFLGISSNTLILTGAAMLLQGVSTLFGRTKAPKDEEDKGQKSPIFSGGVNTTTEGGRMPVGYGRHRIGLIVLSARVFSYQVRAAGTGYGAIAGAAQTGNFRFW